DRLSRAPGIRIHQMAELRTIFFGFDQLRDELLKSDVRGRNPFRDQRVRQAFDLAIDREAIVRTVMRGQAIARARAMDAELAAGRVRGPLHGIPWAAKDILDTKGVRTTWGAEPWKDRV
ncbi:MAG: ABC transporter substrate-binding protein, partial [bacterium]